MRLVLLSPPTISPTNMTPSIVFFTFYLYFDVILHFTFSVNAESYGISSFSRSTFYIVADRNLVGTILCILNRLFHQ